MKQKIRKNQQTQTQIFEDLIHYKRPLAFLIMNKKSRHKTEVIKQIIGKGILPITLGQQILGVLEKIDYFLVKYKLLKFIKNNKK